MRNVRRIRDLASGGMGKVELVVSQDGGFARAYVRKRLSTASAVNGDIVSMFLEEGRIAGLVHHANVVPVIDAGEDADGPYLLMDLVVGVSLQQLLRRTQEGLPVQVAVEIAGQIADGLHAAHELVAPGGRPMGLVHRDLSPANVLLGYDGVARITDFGVARATDRETSQPGLVVGKRSYMPPEQGRGDDVDRRADLFALGVVLIEMLVGRTVRREAHEPAHDPGEDRTDLPVDLVALIFELTALDRSARPADGRAVSSRLRAIHRALLMEEDPVELGELLRSTFEHERASMERELGEALEDEEPTRLERTSRPAAPVAPPSRTLRYGLALAAGAVVLGLGAFFGWPEGPAPEAEALPLAPDRAPDPSLEPPPEPSSPEPLEVVEEELDPPPMDEAPVAPATPPNRARTRPRSEREGSGIRTWGWD